MSKKIAWMGAHGSAKTTTVNRVATLLRDLKIPCNIITEVARDCPFPISEDSGAMAQMWMIAEQISREAEMENMGVYVLCDRSIWDYLAYSYQLFEDGKMEKDAVQAIRRLCRNHAVSRPYEKIYFCEPKPLYSDGVRSTDDVWREKVYQKFKRVIKEEALYVTMIQ